MFTGMTSLFTVQMYRLEEQRREAVAKERQDYISPRADVIAPVTTAGQSERRGFSRQPAHCAAPECAGG